MTWLDLMAMIVEEVGAEAAARIERRARTEFGGIRITILKQARVDADRIDTIAPGKPCQAARKLGIHPSTAYRALRRERIIR